MHITVMSQFLIMVLVRIQFTLDDLWSRQNELSSAPKAISCVVAGGMLGNRRGNAKV
jgi:hypothetical protein